MIDRPGAGVPRRQGAAGGRPPRTRYTAVAIALHWIIAALLATNLSLGWLMTFSHGLRQFNLFQLHKSVGITILLASLLRLAWRLANRPPPPVPGLRPWERTAARVVHVAFYVLIIGMPLSGWLLVSTSPLAIPTLLYHLVPWPHFPGVRDLAEAPKAAVNHASATTHLIFAWSAMALLVLHVGAVIKHQLLGEHPVLGRMLPHLGFGPAPRPES